MVKDVQISLILKEGKLNEDTIFNLSYWKTNLSSVTPNIDIDVRENWHSYILSHNIYCLLEGQFGNIFFILS